MKNKRLHWLTRAVAALSIGTVVALAGFPADSAQAASKKRATAVESKKQVKAGKKSKRSEAVAKRKSKAVLAKAGQRGSSKLTQRKRSKVVMAAGLAGASGVAVSAAAATSVDSFGSRMGLRQSDTPIDLSSSAVLVLDQNTHEVLLSKNDSAVLPIASLTKMMTGLVIADARLPMDETIVITDDDVDRLKNSGSRLAVGTRLTRGEALHLALMSSENRAAHALGRTFPGGREHFVSLMNQKAAQLGMRDTRFVDPTGLSSSNQSSARDLARLVAVAYERPMLRDLSTSPSYEVSTGRRVLQYRNSNRLVHAGTWDIGLQKTGYIREAGRCLVMQASVAGRQLIMVLLDAAGPAARVGDAERVRRWVESGPHGKVSSLMNVQGKNS